MENNSLGEISSLTPAVRPIRMGIDVGSTTVKVVALGENDELLYGAYERHRADIRNTIITVVNKAFDSLEEVLPAKENQTVSVKVTGSGGLSVSQWLNIPFIQEVVAATTAVRKIIPQTDVVIELGGEDAKITYFKGGVEQRMNGTCAGGTGGSGGQFGKPGDGSGPKGAGHRTEPVSGIPAGDGTLCFCAAATASAAD